jgi:hypothetical protein
MRLGQISASAGAKHFSNATLRATKVQPSKMAPFEHKDKDEGSKGRGHVGPDSIDTKALQKDRVGSMPSKGGAVNAHQIPKRGQIDSFPAKQHEKFPKGTHTHRAAAKPKINTRVKAKIQPSGPLLGGPNSRADG